MFSDVLRLCDLEKEKMIELVRETTIYNIREEVKEEGILFTIKSMLNKNYPLKEISDITGKSLNEIKEI